MPLVVHHDKGAIIRWLVKQQLRPIHPNIVEAYWRGIWAIKIYLEGANASFHQQCFAHVDVNMRTGELFLQLEVFCILQGTLLQCQNRASVFDVVAEENNAH